MRKYGTNFDHVINSNLFSPFEPGTFRSRAHTTAKHSMDEEVKTIKSYIYAFLHEILIHLAFSGVFRFLFVMQTPMISAIRKHGSRSSNLPRTLIGRVVSSMIPKF